MSKFKETIAADIVATFINANEFAEEYDINGRKVLAVIDRFSNDKREALFNYGHPAAPAYGVYAENIVIYVSIDELGYKPVADELMDIDGESCIVISCSEDAGMLTIVLEGNRS